MDAELAARFDAIDAWREHVAARFEPMDARFDQPAELMARSFAAQNERSGFAA